MRSVRTSNKSGEEVSKEYKVGSTEGPVPIQTIYINLNIYPLPKSSLYMIVKERDNEI